MEIDFEMNHFELGPNAFLSAKALQMRHLNKLPLKWLLFAQISKLAEQACWACAKSSVHFKLLKPFDDRFWTE